MYLGHGELRGGVDVLFSELHVLALTSTAGAVDLVVILIEIARILWIATVTILRALLLENQVIGREVRVEHRLEFGAVRRLREALLVVLVDLPRQVQNLAALAHLADLQIVHREVVQHVENLTNLG